MKALAWRYPLGNIRAILGLYKGSIGFYKGSIRVI